MTKIHVNAKRVANILLETQCVLFRPQDPFVLTSGKKSPVYVDCRRLISFPKERQAVIHMGIKKLKNSGIADNIDVIAGGETAGIAYAAWVADRLNAPMAYIRKKAKGFGCNARIEGHIKKGDTVLLVEDMTTDGKSKVSFVEAIRGANAHCNHCFVIFSYGIFPQALSRVEENTQIQIHSLANWWDILSSAVEKRYFTTSKTLKIVEDFLHNPIKWQQENA